MTHIYVTKAIFGSNNACRLTGAIIWTIVGILLIRTLGTKFSDFLFEIHTFWFKEMHLNMSSGKWRPFCLSLNVLTHWGRVSHICVSKLTIFGSDNGLSPGRRQAIIWTQVGILLIGHPGTNFNGISIEINSSSFMKIHLKTSSGK